MTRRAEVCLTLALVAALIAGCNGVVGGTCLPGYALSDGRCVPTTQPDGAGGPFTMPIDATADSTPCSPPLVDCFGSCTDLSSNANSCGACGAYCASGICNGGVCRVARVGHVALIGHDYTVGRTDQNLVVGNAVFLSPHVPLRILSLATYAATGAIANVDAAIRQVANARPWIRNELTDPTAVGAELSVDHFDVFLAYAQSSATDDQIGSLAATIAGPLVGFARAGGVVIVLDAPGANAGTFPVANAMGALSIASLTPVTGDALAVAGPADALAIGLPANYRGEHASVAFQLGGSSMMETGIPSASTTDTTVVVRDDAGPVVIHTVVLPP